MKVIIIGGVAGGATAAARLRRLSEKSEIIILEKGEYISYANCGLPYYIGGVIKEQSDILVQTPESLKERFNIDVRIFNEALSIDRIKKEVLVKDIKKNKQYLEKYDKLILSPGAEPLKPQIKGIDSKKVFTLRSIADAELIKKSIVAGSNSRVIIVGAGYIGLEMAENLHRLGIFVTIIEMAPQIISPLDIEMSAAVHKHLRTKNIEFYLSEQVSEIREVGKGVSVVLISGKELPADFMIMSVGVRPDTKLARKAGLSIGTAGGIWVNRFLQTSDENIYAVGDAIEFPDPIFNEPKVIPLAGPANKQGRIAAGNISAGNREIYKGSVGTSIAKVFDMTVGLTGFSERALQKKGVEYYSTITYSSSNAGYYPGGMPLTIKLNYSKKDGQVFGAQVVGYKGVDKACEVLSLACQHNMTVYDLKEMDQAYAPPYSSAKSPVNVAGFVAANVLSGLVKPATRDELSNPGAESFILDVRDIEEVSGGRMPGSHLIPLNQLRKRMNEVPRDKKIFILCAVGQRSYVASRILMQSGYNNVSILSGGCKTFEISSGAQADEDIYGKFCIQKNDDFLSKNCNPPGKGDSKLSK